MSKLLRQYSLFGWVARAIVLLSLFVDAFAFSKGTQKPSTHSDIPDPRPIHKVEGRSKTQFTDRVSQLPTESLEKFKVKNKKYMVHRSILGGVSRQQVIVGPNSQELMIDYRGTGKVDHWEFVKDDVTLRASLPFLGVFRRLEYIREESKSSIRAEFFYDFKNRKYFLTKTERVKHQTFAKEDFRIGSDVCDDRVSGTSQTKAFGELLRKLTDQIEDKTKKNDYQALANELKKEIEKNKNRIFDKSCLEGKFKEDGSLDLLMQAMANVMTSVPDKENNATYLQCLEQEGMAPHSARIRSQFFYRLNGQDPNSKPATAKSYGAQPPWQKPLVVCDDYSAMSAGSELTISEAHHAKYADFNQDTRQITFYQNKNGMAKLPLVSGLYDKKDPEISGADARALKNFELSFFHEMTHRSEIENEKVTHAIQDCCGLPSSKEGGACKAVKDRVSFENKVIKMRTAFESGDRKDQFADLNNAVTVTFATKAKQDNFLNDFLTESAEAHVSVEQAEDDCLKSKRLDLTGCHKERTAKLEKELSGEAKRLCSREFKTEAEANAACGKIVQLAGQLAIDTCELPPAKISEMVQEKESMIPENSLGSANFSAVPTKRGSPIDKLEKGSSNLKLPPATLKYFSLILGSTQLIADDTDSATLAKCAGSRMSEELKGNGKISTEMQPQINRILQSSEPAGQAGRQETEDSYNSLKKEGTTQTTPSQPIASTTPENQQPAVSDQTGKSTAVTPLPSVPSVPTVASTQQPGPTDIVKAPDPVRSPASVPAASTAYEPTSALSGTSPRESSRVESSRPSRESNTISSESFETSSLGRSRKGYETDRSSAIFDRIASGVSEILPQAQAGTSREMTKKTNPALEVLKSNLSVSPSAADKSDIKTVANSNPAEKPVVQNTGEKSLSQKMAEAGNAEPAANRSGTEAVRAKANGSSAPSGAKSSVSSVQVNGGINSDGGADFSSLSPSAELLLKEIKNDPTLVLKRMHSRSQVEILELKGQLEQMNRQLIDENGKTIGSSDPDIIHRYNKRSQKFDVELRRKRRPSSKGTKKIGK